MLKRSKVMLLCSSCLHCPHSFFQHFQPDTSVRLGTADHPWLQNDVTGVAFSSQFQQELANEAWSYDPPRVRLKPLQVANTLEPWQWIRVAWGEKACELLIFFHTVSRGYANCNTDTNHCSANLWGLERPDQQACAAMIAMTVSQILRLISKIWIYLQSTGIRCTVGSLLLFNHIDSMMWSCHQFKRDMLHFCCVYGTFLDRRRDSSDGQTIFCIAWKDRRGKLSVPTDKPW